MTTKFTTTLLAVFLCLCTAHAQKLKWAKAIDEISRTYAISELSAGGVIYAGSFSGMVDMDPGTGTATFVSQGAEDMFITKLDDNGNWQWTKTIGSTGYDNAYDMVTDASDNIYVAGFFNGTVDFDPGAGTANLTSAGGEDGFLLKLDAAGDYQWAMAIAGTGYQDANKLLLNQAGNILLAGKFDGKVDFNPSTAAADTAYRTAPATGFFNSDIFLAEYTPAGAFVRVGAITGPSTKEMSSLAEDNQGNIYCTGAYLDTVDVDPAEGVSHRLSTQAVYNTFVLKLNDTGAMVWATDFDADTSLVQPGDIGVDANGDIYVVGEVNHGKVDFNNSPAPGDTALIIAPNIGGTPFPGHTFICKLNGSGQFVWLRSILGYSYATGIEVEPSGNYYLSGTWNGRADLNLGPAPGDTAFAEAGTDPYNDFNSYLVYGTANGNAIWWGSVGRTELYGGATRINSLHLGNNHLYTGGSYESRTDLDPGVDSLMFEGVNYFNKAWVLKMDRVPLGIKDLVQQATQVVAWPNPSATGSYQLSLGHTCAQLSLSVYNSNGQLVMQRSYTYAENIKLQLDAPPGMYFAVMTDEQDRHYMARLVK